MLGLRALAFSALALSSSVLASFEPLDAQDLFARSPASFEPLDVTPSMTKRSVAAHLPKAHAARGVSINAGIALDVNLDLTTAFNSLVPVKNEISSICGGAGKGSDPTEIIGKLDIHLSLCVQIVTDCSGNVHHHHHHHRHHHHPSGKPGSGGSPGQCSGSLKEIIKLIEELLVEVKDLVKEFPELASTLDSHIETLDNELSNLVTETESAVAGVAALLSTTLTGLTATLQGLGLTALLDTVAHLL